MDFKSKIFAFMAAMSYVYVNDEEREDMMLPSLKLSGDELTEDFTALIYAAHMFYMRVTGDECDIIDFLGIATRLIFQQLAKDKSFAEDSEESNIEKSDE